jgi:hypothetical protein
MKIKTQDLTGSVLDWAVAICEPTQCNPDHYSPSTDWSQGGPIIEREGISAMQTDADSGDWEASIWLNPDKHMPLIQEGPTPLIAAMRCYVASQLGDEVAVPDDVV